MQPENLHILNEDALSFLKSRPDHSVDLTITSPPYFHKRDYKTEGQLGQEKTHWQYIDNILTISKEIYRVLKPTGSFWLNIADSYGGNLNDSGTLLGIPQRIFIRMLDEQGWLSPNYCPWYKSNASPSPFLNRFTNMYEPFMWFVKSKRTRLWQDAKTFEWYYEKPQIQQFTWEPIEGKVTKTGKPKRRKTGINYYGHRYFFDLEKIRIPQQYPQDVQRIKKQDGEDGVLPFAKGNTDGIPWRRDQLPKGAWVVKGIAYTDQLEYRKALLASRGQDITYQFSKEKRYSGKFKGSGEASEEFGSPRARNERNKYDQTMIREGGAAMSSPRGKNPGDVFKVPTYPLKEQHFAPFPERLILPLVMACSPPPRPEVPSIVMDPFNGSGTVALCADLLNREYYGSDINAEYIDITWRRINKQRALVKWLEKFYAPKIDFYLNYANGMDKFLGAGGGLNASADLDSGNIDLQNVPPVLPSNDPIPPVLAPVSPEL